MNRWWDDHSHGCDFLAGQLGGAVAGCALSSLPKATPWDFFWRITLEGLAASSLVALLTWLLGLPGRADLNYERSALLGMAVVVALILETVLFQALPIGLARLVKVKFRSQVVWSTVLFAVAHTLSSGIATGLCAGLIGGFYFAFTYAHWRERSRWTAFWSTALSHAVQNAIIVWLDIEGGGV